MGKIKGAALAGGILAVMVAGCGSAVEAQSKTALVQPRGKIIIPENQPRFGFKETNRAHHVRLKQSPVLVGALSSLLMPDEYPARALRASVQGTTKLAFIVGENGHVTSCQPSGGNEEPDPYGFYAYSCHFISVRARFLPARNLQNRPVSAPVAWTILWKIPSGWRSNDTVTDVY
jgi:hypothetical protein